MTGGRTAAWSVLLLAASVCAGPAASHTLSYIEPGLAACPAPPAAPAGAAAAPQTVRLGAAVAGRIQVRCGFTDGSYTVTLNSSDPGAAFAPKTFLVNFGRVVGKGSYVVSFSTPGLQTVSASITPNMGSPTLRGQFVSAGNGFQVVTP